MNTAQALAEERNAELLRRPLYLYQLPGEVLESLTLKQVASDEVSEPEDLPQIDTARSEPASAQSCSLCGLAFDTVQDQRGHLKSDLHHYNLKQKLRGLQPVTEADFEKLLTTLDESLSGSESEESEDEDRRKDTVLSALLKKQASLADGRRDDGDSETVPAKHRGSGKSPLLWFSSPLLPENTHFGIYRTVFNKKELENESEMLDVIRKKQLAPIAAPKKDTVYKGPHIFMCMIGGGHFAAMVVSLAPRQTKTAGPMNREATVLAHKTFHRYTTRRKQGGSQSANDNAKGAAHSAGSSLRRYNEQALVQDVRELLKDWKPLIDTSELLFVRATGSVNRRTLFGPYDDQILNDKDDRIRGFPFNTRRATQNELMRCFIELTRLKVKTMDPPVPEESRKPSAPTVAKPTLPSLSEEDEAAQLHTSQLQALIRRSKLPALLSYLQSTGLDAGFRFFPADAQHHAPTCLHLAAAQGSAPLVTGLLVRAGADPTLPNGEGKTAFELAGDRATRDAFRVARGELGEAAWDWDGAARVPPALTRAEADHRTEQERNRRHDEEEARRRAEEKRLAAEKPDLGPATAEKVRRGIVAAALTKTAQDRREDETRGLTDEQKRRLERERRARAAEARLRGIQGGA